MPADVDARSPSGDPTRAALPATRILFGCWCHFTYIDIVVITKAEVISMPAVTIRILPDETHRALRVRAAHNGRGTEADIRDIIEAAARPFQGVKLGSLLLGIGRNAELSNEDVEALQRTRDDTPAEPMTFE
jgi:plasmid stability protein